MAVGYTGFYVPEKNDAVHLTVGANCAYPTRTIAITYGQRLEITNQSKLLFAPLIDERLDARRDGRAAARRAASR